MPQNPWLPSVPAQESSETGTSVATVIPTGATAPQPAVTGVDRADRLAEVTVTDGAPVWVVGAHGGAGESTVADLLGGVATAHRWPRRVDPAPVLLVARTHATGLRRAQLAMRSWAAGQTPAVRLLGLLLVADAPGRLPKQLEHTAQTLGGGVPHVWRMPWVEDLRVLPAAEIRPPRQVTKVLAEIHTVLSAL